MHALKFTLLAFLRFYGIDHLSIKDILNPTDENVFTDEHSVVILDSLVFALNNSEGLCCLLLLCILFDCEKCHLSGFTLSKMVHSGYPCHAEHRAFIFVFNFLSPRNVWHVFATHGIVSDTEG